MSDGLTNIGTETAIALDVPASDTIALYNDLSYETMSLVSELSEFGGDSDSSEFIPMLTGIKEKGTGAIDYNDMTITFKTDTAEAGQLAAHSAFDGDHKGLSCTIRITSAAGNVIFMRGTMGSYKDNIGSTGDIPMSSCVFRINAKPVPATAAEIAALQFLIGTVSR